jgi:hypothetical protein
MARIVLIVNGLVFGMIGLGNLFVPADFLGEFGVVLSSAMALAEARAVHGGGYAALAILMGLGLLRPDRFEITALRAAAFVMGGLAFGRFVGILVDGATDMKTIVATAGEVVLCGVAIGALFRVGPTVRNG